MSKDPYKALGLLKSASDAEIKKAYRKLARIHHPDLNPGDTAAEEKFKAASAAYDLLKDPETRARFDRGEIDASGAEKKPERKFYRDYAQQQNHGYQSSQGYADMGDMSDVFADILRRRGQSGQARQGQGGFDTRGADARYMLDVDFMEAVKGGKKRISLPGGDNLEVAIPQGVADGQTIRLRGKGGEGSGKGPRGDAYVKISVGDHRFFERDGDDIRVILPITIDEAMLGGKVPTPTINGSVNLTIPAGASSGQTLRLRGRGVTRAGKPAGDQRVELRIVAPPKVDAELQDFLQEWRKKNSYDPRRGMSE